jgi:hypothetical protein
MRIKTITCHDVYNLGASLQAYALQRFLQEQGHDVAIIDYKPFYLSGHFKLWNVSNPKFNKPLIKQLYLCAKLPGRLLALKRKNVFDHFTANFLKLTKRYHNLEELQEDAPLADIYIAGSDQIWNTQFPNGNDAAFYLDFGNARKISYAASFATNSLEEGSKNFVQTKLNNFNSISVREASGLKILDSIGFNGVQVVDPVFLIHRESWDDIEDHSGENEKYILAYDFDKHGPIGVIAKRLSKLLKCKIYSIGPFRMHYAHRNFVNAGPDTFISLIKNSQCVLSNSFHASAFAMIYNKDFFVIEREDGLNQRMRDLLKKYSLLERIVSLSIGDEELQSSIDYSDVNEGINQDVKRSKSFLLSQLNEDF